MRRGKLSNKSIFFIILAGFFTLGSYFLDQQVIQKEDKIRDQSLSIEKLYQEISQKKYKLAINKQCLVIEFCLNHIRQVLLVQLITKFIC